MATKKSKKIDDIRLEGTRLIYPNFAGKETKFKPAGNRETGLVIKDMALIQALQDDGWNIKLFKPNPDTGEIDGGFIMAKVSYQVRPPKIVMVSDKQVYLDEDTIEQLDWADITNVDAVVSPYLWEVNGRSGVSAYLKEAYITIEKSVFADKYSGIPLASQAVSSTDSEIPF